MSDTQTIEQFWRGVHGDAVVWRKAKQKAHTCGGCRRTIELGERYLDAAEVIGRWRTVKYCAACAACAASVSSVKP